LVDAVVLAGGSAKDLAPVSAKGLVPVNGRPMVEYVVDSLCRCTDIDRICVVLPVEHSFSCFDSKVGVAVADGSLPEVARAGINFLNADKPVLFLSADVPLITPEAITDFLDRCSEREAGVYYPIVRYGESEKRFPGIKRTYVRITEGRFTGGNIMLMKPQVITRNMELMERIYELRKSPFKLFQILGFTFLIKFVLGWLSISQVEERVGQMTNSICAGIITPFVEIGIDVDKESDLQLAAAALSGGNIE